MSIKTFIALSTIFFSSTLFAGADCPKAPKSDWMSKFAMQKKIINDYGFAIKKFKIDGDCYEIYGWEVDESGKETQKIEVYFNPVNGNIVKKEID